VFETVCILARVSSFLRWGLLTAVLAVATALFGAGSASAAAPACSYGTVAYAYDAPALLSSPGTAATGARGSPSMSEAASWGSPASARDHGVAANTAARTSSVVDDVLAETAGATRRNLTSSYTLSADEALSAGQRWVGQGYTELGKPGSGVFRSADGLRQFRMDGNSLMGNHAPGVPHVHLETYAPGARVPTVNNHIPFLD
jgi:hypothetical protein